MAQVYKTLFFEINFDIPTILGQGTPSFRNKIAEMCYLYRSTGLTGAMRPAAALHDLSPIEAPESSKRGDTCQGLA